MLQLPTEFGLYRAVNGRHKLFVSACLKKADEQFAQQQGIAAVYANVKSLLATEEACFALVQALANTEEVERLDSERDRLFNYVCKVVSAATLLPLADMAQAAARLAKQLAPFKGASEKPYDDNTSYIQTFVERMSAPQCVQDMAALGLTPVMQALDNTNTLFAQTYMGRTSELRQRVKGETMKTIRPKVDEAIIQYFQAINAVYQVNELVTHDATRKAALEDVITTIDGYIVQLRITLDRSLGTGGPDNTPDPTEDTPGLTPGDDQPETPTPSGEDQPGAENEPDTPATPTTPGDNDNPGGGGTGGNSGDDWGGFS